MNSPKSASFEKLGEEVVVKEEDVDFKSEPEDPTYDESCNVPVKEESEYEFEYISADLEEYERRSSIEIDDVKSEIDSDEIDHHENINVATLTKEVRKTSKNSKQRKYPCDSCSRIYVYRQRLETHQIKVHGKEEPSTTKKKRIKKNIESPNQLDELTEQDSQSSDITNGDSSNNNTDKRKFMCHLCDNVYTQKGSLATHIRKAHPSANREDLQCKYCDKKCEDEASRNIHQKTHTGNKRFVCPHCQKTFRNRYKRQDHIATNHTGDRRFKCPHCPKTFKLQCTMAFHVRIHSNVRKYACDYCDKRFIQATHKMVHEMTKHSRQIPHECPQCGRRYATSEELAEHLKNHENVRNYICEICDKPFYGNARLKDHMLSHTGEKPFQCHVCGNYFPRMKYLKSHLAIHRGEKNVVCKECGRAFTTLQSLNSHRKRWHKDTANKRSRKLEDLEDEIVSSSSSEDSD